MLFRAARPAIPCSSPSGWPTSARQTWGVALASATMSRRWMPPCYRPRASPTTSWPWGTPTGGHGPRPVGYSIVPWYYEKYMGTKKGEILEAEFWDRYSTNHLDFIFSGVRPSDPLFAHEWGMNIWSAISCRCGNQRYQAFDPRPSFSMERFNNLTWWFNTNATNMLQTWQQMGRTITKMGKHTNFNGALNM